jgi:hypothetical protein
MFSASVAVAVAVVRRTVGAVAVAVVRSVRSPSSAGRSLPSPQPARRRSRHFEKGPLR